MSRVHKLIKAISLSSLNGPGGRNSEILITASSPPVPSTLTGYRGRSDWSHNTLLVDKRPMSTSTFVHSCGQGSPRRFSSSCANDTVRVPPASPSQACEIHTGTGVRSTVTSPKVSESRLMENPKLVSKEEREQFMSLFPQLVRDLTEMPEFRDMPETNRWVARVLQYNVPHGKRTRGLSTALAYRYLANEVTDENMKLAMVLGWCVEMLQAYLLVADDIMDGSETRRGRPCWYKLDNLGPSGFNDAILLESTVFMILKKYFREKEYYIELMEVMHDINHRTIYGQSLDTRTGLERKMETYTMDLYSSIVKYKTSYYTFYLPVRLAMAMVSINESEVLQQVETVALEIGHFFQVQDDYLDCFGDVNVTGKIGTDIQDCKCSWLFIVAMQKSNSEQKKVLLDNYGHHDPEKVERVKKIYWDLDLPETYNQYEEQTYNLICTHIKQMSARLPKQLFFDLVNKIYRRAG